MSRVAHFLRFSLPGTLLPGAIFFCVFSATSISAQDDVSMKERSTQIPEWFDEAKLGIFIPVSYTHLTLPTNREV